MRSIAASLLLLSVALLSGCAPLGDARSPIPVEWRGAADGETLVVILPGRRDDLEGLRRAGIADVFERHWPHARVVLAEASLAYYREGGLARRLHAEVIAPARAQGVRRVWLCGASMGGLGSVLYALEHPGEVEGLILLAPYLGEPERLVEVEAAGGLRAFDPGPAQPLTRENFDRELWKGLARWARAPKSAPQLHVVYGRDDPLVAAAPHLAPLVPPERLHVHEGGHRWSVWTPAAEAIVAEIASRR